MNFKKLAAIDVAFLGPKLIITEFAVGVFFSAALGVFTLLRSHSISGLLIGLYLISLGVNYIPMLVYAITVRGYEKARLELGGELISKRAAMSKYRRQSLWLLVPLAVPLFALLHRTDHQNVVELPR